MKKILEIIRKLSLFSIFIFVGIAILVLVYILEALPIPLTIGRIILGLAITIGLALIIYTLVRDLRDFLKNKEPSKKKWSWPSILSFLFMIVYLTILFVVPKPTTITPVEERFAAFYNLRFVTFFVASIIGFVLAIYGLYDARKNNKKGELIASIAAVLFGFFMAFGLFITVVYLLPTEEISNLFERLEKKNE